jgi:lysophospholipase L1-like esterase
VKSSAKSFPVWAIFSLFTNGLLILGILLIWQQQRLKAFFRTNPYLTSLRQANSATTQLGPRHKLNYQQWVDILAQEAQVAAEKRPPRLSILVGDSLSVWFPPELLPQGRNWLNQGISGEKSDRLLKRLKVFDRTQPELILVMIGINDLTQGVSDEVILENQRQIMSYLHQAHPKAQVIIQSILPHGGEDATWEGREKLLSLPNSRIRRLNQQLQAIAKEQGVKYLDLYPLFTNQQGNLHRNFTSDGLHLSPQGYVVWRTALQIHSP